MNAHPINTESLRREALGQLGLAAMDPRWPGRVLSLLDALAAAEHRATRAEAQSAIRGRAVVMYRERARQAEAERDEWRQTALDERAAALDALEQVKVRDARIRAVERLALAADDGTEYEHNGHPAHEGEAECPGCWALGIRNALDGDA